MTNIAGGDGIVEIVGRSATAVWGQFGGRYCFTNTPGSNCFSVYGGRFSATLPAQEPATVDYGVPPGYPPLNAQFRAHGTWRNDRSGFANVPNEIYASVDEIPVAEGVQTFGALYRSGIDAYTLEFDALPEGEVIEIELPSLDVGLYDLTTSTSNLARTEYRGGRFTYITNIDGGSGFLEIVGRSATALWGRFEGRHCFRPTPRSNCFTLYEGRFSATIP